MSIFRRQVPLIVTKGPHQPPQPVPIPQTPQQPGPGSKAYWERISKNAIKRSGIKSAIRIKYQRMPLSFNVFFISSVCLFQYEPTVVSSGPLNDLRKSRTRLIRKAPCVDSGLLADKFYPDSKKARTEQLTEKGVSTTLV